MEKNEKNKNDNLCYVCHKNQINIRVMPCGHAYLCRKCAMKMASGKCRKCHDYYIDVKGILPGEPLSDDSDDDNDEKSDNNK